MGTSARIDELQKKFNESPRRYFAPLANEYRKAGDLDRAIALCREYLPQQPAHMSGHIVFGQALFEAGELDEAGRVFETALSLDPENLIALRHLGDIARERGEIESARGWYRRVLDADPRNDEIAGRLAALPSGSDGSPQSTPVEVEQPQGLDGWGDIHPHSPEAAASAAAESVQAPAESESRETQARERPEPGEMDLELDTTGLDTGSLDVSAVETTALDLQSPYSDEETPGHSREGQAVAEREPQQDAGTGGRAETMHVDEAERGDDASAEPGEPAGSVAALEQLEQSTEVDFSPHGPTSDRTVSEPGPEPGDRELESELDLESLFRDESSPAAAEGAGEHAAADLGLETMEFVPPDSGVAERRPEPREVSDPFAGNVFDGETSVGEGSAPPPAFVTETMAELYLQQGFRDEALRVYEQLLARNPGDPGLRDRVEQLQRGSSSSVGAAEVSQEVIESAARRRADARSIRAFLAEIARRRPRVSHEEPAQGFDAGDTVADADSPADGAATAEHAEEGSRWDEARDRAPHTGVESDTLDSFFGGATVDEADDAAAASLASAFADAGAVAGHGTSAHFGENGEQGASTGDAERGAPRGQQRDQAGTTASMSRDPESASEEAHPTGRPTRAAATPLSLDSVFREGEPRPSAQSQRSSFSFDQFFSEGSRTEESAPQGEETPEEDGPPSRDDVGQFNSWLEGLKKK